MPDNDMDLDVTLLKEKIPGENFGQSI